MTGGVRIAAIAVLVSSVGLGVQAQSADDKELLQYRLTPEVLSKVDALAKAYAANLAKDPAVKRRLDARREIAALEKKDELTEAEEKRLQQLEVIVGDQGMDPGIDGGSLTQIAAQFGKIPAMAAALKSTGVLPRDLAKFTVTATQAALVVGLGAKNLPPGLAPENVKFAAANRAELERIMRQFDLESR